QIDPVVRIPSVGRASASRHEPCLAQLAEVIRNEVLRFAGELCELADPTVAERQLTEQPPAKWVGYQLEELERGFDAICRHVRIVSNEIDIFKWTGPRAPSRSHGLRSEAPPGCAAR